MGMSVAKVMTAKDMRTVVSETGKSQKNYAEYLLMLVYPLLIHAPAPNPQMP
jgi:hypothetical protein